MIRVRQSNGDVIMTATSTSAADGTTTEVEQTFDPATAIGVADDLEAAARRAASWTLGDTGKMPRVS